jgi:hypothetical protein
MKLANEAHFSLGFDPVDYNTCTNDAYVLPASCDKGVSYKDLGKSSVNIQHAQ